MFTGRKHHCPLNSTVSKTSSGAMELIDIFLVNNSLNFVEQWKENGGSVIATSIDVNRPHTSAQNLRFVLEKEGKSNILLILGS